MKRIDKILGLGFLLTLITLSCKKVVEIRPNIIDLGIKSKSTTIKSVKQVNNVVTAEFATTAGSKYSVRIVPFNSDEPVKKEGFTANDSTTVKTYDLSNLKRMNYDLIFIDISGKEIKYPIIIN
jgi:hypothetical protein